MYGQAQTSGPVAPSATRVKPNAPIRGEIDGNHGEIGSALVFAHELLSRLEQKVAPVLRPVGPTGNADGTSKPPSGSPLAESMREQLSLVRSLNERLIALEGRLDL